MKLDETTKCEKCAKEPQTHAALTENSEDEKQQDIESSSSSSSSTSEDQDESSIMSKSAVVKCIECDTSLCASCLIDHRNQEETAQHTLTAISSPVSAAAELGSSSSLDTNQLMQNFFNELNNGGGENAELLAKISENLKAMYGQHVTASAVNGDQLQDESTISVEKKRDCHESEYMSDAFRLLKVEPLDMYHGGLIKRRYSNLDNSELLDASKLAEKSALNGKLDSELEESVVGNNSSGSGEDNKSMLMAAAVAASAP
jgi:hypothetical protein